MKTAEEIAAEAEIKEEESKPSKDEEDVVTIGEDTPPPEEDSSVIRKMRERHKDLKRQNRELQDKVDAGPEALEIKPTLESCGYDNDKYDADLNNWYEKKSAVSKKQTEVELARKQQDADWQKKLDIYGEKKTALNVPDYEEAEESVHDSFSETQQGLIIQGADNPAVVIYALGKNSKRAKELAAEKDPVKFVAKMSRLEAQMNVTKRKAATTPEEVVVGSGASAVNVNTTLKKLREEADKTGDYSKVTAYRRAQREK